MSYFDSNGSYFAAKLFSELEEIKPKPALPCVLVNFDYEVQEYRADTVEINKYGEVTQFFKVASCSIASTDKEYMANSTLYLSPTVFPDMMCTEVETEFCSVHGSERWTERSLVPFIGLSADDYLENLLVGTAANYERLSLNEKMKKMFAGLPKMAEQRDVVIRCRRESDRLLDTSKFPDTPELVKTSREEAARKQNKPKNKDDRDGY